MVIQFIVYFRDLDLFSFTVHDNKCFIAEICALKIFWGVSDEC